MVIFTVTLGILLGIAGKTIFDKIKAKRNAAPTYLRRGIYEHSFNYTTGRIYAEEKGEFLATFEIGEIESTDELSKINIISFKTSKSEFSTDKGWKSRIFAMVDNTWVNQSEIKWIQKSIADKRDEKLRQILK